MSDSGITVKTKQQRESEERIALVTQGLKELEDIKAHYNRLREEGDFSENEIIEAEVAMFQEMDSKLDSFKAYVSNTLHKLANIVSPVNQEEKMQKDAIRSLSVEVLPEDLDNPEILTDYVDFCSSQKPLAKIGTFTHSEIILLVAQKFRTVSTNAHKLALVHKMVDSVLLNKNMDNLRIASVYFMSKNKLPTNSAYLDIIQKHKDYQKIKDRNLAVICNHYNIEYSVDNMYDKKMITAIEKEYIVANVAQYCKIFDKNIDNLPSIQKELAEYEDVKFEGSGENKAFSDFGKTLLKLGFKDPKGILDNRAMGENINSYLSKTSEPHF